MSDPAPRTALVVGATGGLGAAFVAALVTDVRYERIVALGRSAGPPGAASVSTGTLDLLDEASIAAALAPIASGSLDLVVIATGILQDGTIQPEKSLRALDPAAFAHVLAVNTIGPALVLKHVAPLLPRQGRSVVATLSARVGSIADNRLGGWYSYRASKAALNQIIRTTAIEWARQRPEAICVGLHPGTVDTGLSRPFQSNVAAEKLFTPAESAQRLLAVMDHLTPADSGSCFAWDGTPVPP